MSTLQSIALIAVLLAFVVTGATYAFNQIFDWKYPLDKTDIQRAKEVQALLERAEQDNAKRPRVRAAK